MFALIGLMVQLTIFAFRLLIIAVMWMVRLTVLLVAAVIGALSAVRN